MNLLWLVLGLLLLPALWLLMLPLRRARAVHDAQQNYEAEARTDKQNVTIYRQRLESLEAARERGEIDAERFAESQLELDRSLLEDTEGQRRVPLKSARSGRILIPLVMVALVVVSLLWYQREGAEGDLALYAVQQEVLNSPDGSLTMLIERLEDQAERQPDNPKVWMSLFPLYRDSGRFDQAAQALQQLIELEGRQVALVAQLAQIKFFANQRTLTDEVRALADEALSKDPRQPTVLGMLGIEAFDQARYEQAIEYWRRAIAGFGEGGSAEALREAINVAQQHMGASAERATSADANSQQGPSLTVRVSLAEALRERAGPNDTLFIVARDVAGELPPLAIQRATVADLPLEVTLDDGDAMLPQATLSQVDEVRLNVRISSSGQATPQPGDLMGEAGPLTLDGQAPIEISIDRVVN